MRKLGVLKADEPMTEEASKAYAALFDRPLTNDMLAAI